MVLCFLYTYDWGGEEPVFSYYSNVQRGGKYPSSPLPTGQNVQRAVSVPYPPRPLTVADVVLLPIERQLRHYSSFRTNPQESTV